MKKFGKTTMIVAVMLLGTVVFAAPPHAHKKHKNDGLELANGIVDLVLKVLNPAPTVTVVQTPPPPPAKHYRPAPPPPKRHEVRHQQKPAPAPKPRRR